MKNEKTISRRTFMKSTLATTAASASVLTSSLAAKSMNHKIRENNSSKFKIAAVQMNALKDNLAHNIEVHRRIINEVAEDGCQLVMFPELSVTAHYGEENVTATAEPAGQGKIYEIMHDLAKRYRLVISYGFCEYAHGTFYNSQALVGPDGLIGVHRKVHPSRDEYIHFRMGRSLDVFDIGSWKIGILICYDANFFEAWRVLALKGADILLLPHAGRSGVGIELPLQKQKEHLKGVFKRMPGRYGIYAADNNVFAIYGNQIGYNGHSTHSGGAYLVAPDGKLLAKSKLTLDDHWIRAEIDRAIQIKRRNSPNSIMKDRRPEMYGELTKMI